MSYEDIHGALSGDDIAFLREHARGVVVELGTFCGKGAALMAETAECVYTIDLFEDYQLIEDERSRAHYVKLYAEHPHPLLDVARTLSPFDNIVVIKSLTYEAVSKIGVDKIDVLFTDSDHTNSGLTKDFKAWEPIIKSEGLLIFHDYEMPDWPDVKPFVDGLSTELFPCIGHRGTCIALKKAVSKIGGQDD